MTQFDGKKALRLKDGRVLGYCEYGDLEGAPMIALHGMPGSRLLMEALDQEARTNHARIIAPERPGYGISQPRAKGSLIGYLNDIIELADSLDIPRFCVIGVSGGGPYALACAAKFPHRLSVAALIGAIGPLSLRGSTKQMIASNRIMFSLGRLSPAFAGLVIGSLLGSSLRSLEQHVRNGTSPVPDIPPRLMAVLVKDQREAIRSGGKGVRYDMQAYWQPWGFKMDEISVKVYLWHGEDDNLAPVRLARYVAENVQDCEATFYPNEGHTGPIANHLPEIMTRLVQATTETR